LYSYWARIGIFRIRMISTKLDGGCWSPKKRVLTWLNRHTALDFFGLVTQASDGSVHHAF
jgi:hypothetical protein